MAINTTPTNASPINVIDKLDHLFNEMRSQPSEVLFEVAGILAASLARLQMEQAVVEEVPGAHAAVFLATLDRILRSALCEALLLQRSPTQEFH